MDKENEKKRKQMQERNKKLDEIRKQKEKEKEEREKEWKKLEEMKSELKGGKSGQTKDGFNDFLSWVMNGKNDIGNSKNVLFNDDD